VVVPYLPPEEYALVIEAERTEGKDALIVGLASGDHQFVHVLDGYTAEGKCLSGFELLDRGSILERQATVLISHLSDEIARRELRVVEKRLSWPPEALAIRNVTDSRGPGNALLLRIRSEHATEVIAGFGMKELRAEAVAEQAVETARDYLASGAPVGVHLADQLVLLLALAGSGGFRTLSPSRHLTTNIEVIRTFLRHDVNVEKDGQKSWLVTVR